VTTIVGWKDVFLSSNVVVLKSRWHGPIAENGRKSQHNLSTGQKKVPKGQFLMASRNCQKCSALIYYIQYTCKYWYCHKGILWNIHDTLRYIYIDRLIHSKFWLVLSHCFGLHDFGHNMQFWHFCRNTRIDREGDWNTVIQRRKVAWVSSYNVPIYYSLLAHVMWAGFFYP
jgi:hypothetical protein